jgi:serine/threonine protein kinase
MGEVYRAHDPRLDRDIALKVLPVATADDPAALERFTREARASPRSTTPTSSRSTRRKNPPRSAS